MRCLTAKKCSRKRKKKLSDVPLKIIRLLKKKDRPLIAAHIAKGIKKSAQLVNYHLQKLVEAGILLITTEFDTKYYYLQSYFYLEEAETALMKVLIPWIEEIAKETNITEDVEIERKQAVLNNIVYYFLLFLEGIKKDLA